MKLTTIMGTAIAAVGLAACGSSPGTPTVRPTLAPTATPVATPSPTPVPAPPLVVREGVAAAMARERQRWHELLEGAAPPSDP